MFARALFRKFTCSHSPKTALKGIIAPEKIQNPEEIERVERLLNNLESHQTEAGEWPTESCWHYGKAEVDWDKMCKSQGEYQSPINIDTSITHKSSEIMKENFFPLNTNYTALAKQGKFTTKTFLVQGNFGTLTINPLMGQAPRSFEAAQFHFHAPAEHLLNGYRHDLELHIVHQEKGKPSNMSVIGFFFRNNGIRNPFIDQCIQSLEKESELDLNLVIPKEKMGVYLYEGSLTTPPLFQGILWFLVSNLHSISSDQLDFFRNRWEANPEFAEGKGNYRDVQPLGKRSIIYFD